MKQFCILFFLSLFALSPAFAKAPPSQSPTAKKSIASKKTPPSLSVFFFTTPALPTHLKVPAYDLLSPPHLQAFNTWWSSYGRSKRITFEQEQVHAVRPIASVTKLMLATVLAPKLLDSQKTCLAQLQEEDRDRYKRTYTQLLENTPYSCIDLLSVILTRSDNQSAYALARTVFGSHQGAVDNMNAVAKELKLTNTKFSDPAGLLATNVSSAQDLAKLLVFIQTLNTPLGSFSVHPRFTIHPLQTAPVAPTTEESNALKEQIPNTAKPMTVKNTNKLITKWHNQEAYPKILLSKTGFTNEAGRCLVMSTQFSNGIAHFIVLGSKKPGEREDLINTWVTEKSLHN